MQTYARQGGTSTIFICDDGMQVRPAPPRPSPAPALTPAARQLLPPAERAARQAFYAQHGIGWVARPAHDPAGSGFVRAGRFKKASNMNYGLALSLRVERWVLKLAAEAEAEAEAAASTRGGEGADSMKGLTESTSTRGLAESGEELDVEERALRLALEETYAETGRRWMPWAANGRALRVGEIVLIVDSDTVVPEDCLRDAARELAESPDVAIIQHESGGCGRARACGGLLMRAGQT